MRADADYTDARSAAATMPFAYLTRMVPTGRCPMDTPFTCNFREGGAHLGPRDSGLSRTRGAARPSTQFVGPGGFQVGAAVVDPGHAEVRRGTARPCTALAGTAARLVPSHGGIGETTVERGRNKYDFAVQCTASHARWPTASGCTANHIAVEPFRLGGVATREGYDVVGM